MSLSLARLFLGLFVLVFSMEASAADLRRLWVAHDVYLLYEGIVGGQGTWSINSRSQSHSWMWKETLRNPQEIRIRSVDNGTTMRITPDKTQIYVSNHWNENRTGRYDLRWRWLQFPTSVTFRSFTLGRGRTWRGYQKTNGQVTIATFTENTRDPQRVYLTRDSDGRRAILTAQALFIENNGQYVRMGNGNWNVD